MADTKHWREEYARRQRPLDEAMALIKEGDLVNLNILCPMVLVLGFHKRAQDLSRVDFRVLSPGMSPLFAPDGPRGEKEIELFIGDIQRPAHDARVATYLPNTFMLGLKAFDSGRSEARLPDVNLVACSEPNDQGYVHFGPHMWSKRAYTRRCPVTIAAVDPNLSPVHGDVWVHVSEVAAFVTGAIARADRDRIREQVRTFAPEANRGALIELLDLASQDHLGLVQDLYPMLDPGVVRQALGFVEVDPEAQGIADNLRQIIRDGDTIQVGVGQPSSLMFVAGAFDDAHHLGIHTELGSPGLAKLWERGIVDGSRKTLHRGKAVAVAWTGCGSEDIQIIAGNPAFELHDPPYLLNPALIAQNSRMTAINSAIAVDLLGQIASEDRFGGQMVNGTGGQPDTHLGAALCPDGRAITVMRSTAVGGSISKVVARHEAGTLVTVPRYLADTIITEYGVARLLDKNHRQRADELISIAHPDFRAELRREALDLVGSL